MAAAAALEQFAREIVRTRFSLLNRLTLGHTKRYLTCGLALGVSAKALSRPDEGSEMLPKR